MLKRFSEIKMKDVNICGGKGASLGEMMDAGLPIPNGFVLTTKAYGKNSKEREKEVLKAFDKLNTKFVAVRSSGTKEDGVDDSFAGQFDTYLFVTRENLIKKIKECHASVNSERIVSYCEYKGIDIKSIKVAVVVQKMVNSESAGVCFTVNPVSQNYDEMMIDAGFGVGEAVVSGMITPDNYIVNKKTGEIKKVISQQEKKLVLSDKGGTKEVRIPKKDQESQKLSDKHIQELAELAKKIEKHYGKPMDTEWAIENGELYMLQARPITTLGTKNENITILEKYFDISELGNSSNYVRMFETLYMPFINNYIFNAYYKNLGVMTIYQNNTRTSYIPKKIIPSTLKKGKEIYTNKIKYNQFSKSFERYKSSTILKYENIINNKKFNIKEIKEFLYSLPSFFEYYSKTEFFYTDSLFSPQQTEKERNKLLKIVENVKNPGREFFNKLLFGEQSMLNQILSKISQKTGIEKELLFLSTLEEIIFYTNNLKPNKKTLNNRKKGYVLKGNQNDIKLFYGDIANKYSKNFYNKTKNEKILKGMIANTGKAIGKVKVFKYNYKSFDSLHKIIESMNKGDILVAETTSPELILACKKAGAIITNQGGMMSHAAIVSRELNIPCIVGVNNATKVLKDGMTVEVDANTGTIKIM